MDKLQKARAKMLIKHPFFATLMMSTPAVEVDEKWFHERGVATPTAATDMDKLYYHKPFMESLDDDVVLFVLAHEVMHIALKHGMRRSARNPVIWNIACDYAINLTLRETGFKLWDQCLIGEDKSGVNEYADMSADAIYEKIYKDAEQRAKQMGSSLSDAAEDQHGDGGGMIGDLQEPENAGDPAAQARTERSIQQRVAQAANVARMAGKMTGGLERLVNEILDPKVPWPIILRDFMTRTSKDDERWDRRNRRFQSVYLPARHSERMGPIILIGDTSGSIGNEELKQYGGEAVAIAEDMRPENIRVVWCDAKVKGEQLFEDGDPIELKPVGGGGTDMRVALEYVEQYEPEVVVLFTDGYTPWPEVPPTYPLIVCCTTDAPVPVGLDVRI